MISLRLKLRVNKKRMLALCIEMRFNLFLLRSGMNLSISVFLSCKAI